MLKTRYYKLTLNDDENDTILLRVKKDFYTEGVFVNSDRMIQGYLYFYNDFYLSVLDNNNKDDKISYHLGLRSKQKNNTLYYTHFDEELLNYGKSSEFTFNIEELDDSDILGKIDFLIRSGVKKLDTNIRKIYDFFNNRRMYQYREFKSEMLCPIHKIDGTEYVIIDDPELWFTREDLKEIEQYLLSISETRRPVKGRDENNQKVRKKKRDKKNK